MNPNQFAGPWLNRIRTCRAALFFVPALWVSKDLVLEKIFGGFPWGLTGYSQYNNLLFLQWAQIGGIHLLTFLVILGNILLLRVAAKRGRAWLLVLAVIPLLHAAGWLMLRVHLERLQVLPLENAAIVQPNVTPDDHLRFGSIDLALEKLLEESRTLVRQGASLIIWPEYTIPVYPLQDYRYGDIFDRFALDEVPLLAGFTDLQGLDRIYNSVILFYPGGRSKYDKVRLTPFGEYIPFRRLLFFVRRITDEIGDFTPGAKATNLYLNDLVIAPPICYEIIYPGLVNSFVRKGAQVIITTSNDSWFGRTAAPYQHLSMAVLRAVENRRYVLRSTSNGVSALIESSGIIRRRSAYGRQDAFLAPFHRLSGKTFFSSVGFLFPYLCVLFSLLIPGKKLLSFLWRAAK